MHETMESAKKKKEGFLWTDLKAIWGNNLRRAFHELCFISHGLRVSKSLLIWIQPNSTFILSYHNRLTHYCRICTLHAMRTRQASAHKGRFLNDINISWNPWMSSSATPTHLLWKIWERPQSQRSSLCHEHWSAPKKHELWIPKSLEKKSKWFSQYFP